MANSEDPDDAARNDISSGSTLFAKISILASRDDRVNTKMLTCYLISILKRTRFVLVQRSASKIFCLISPQTKRILRVLNIRNTNADVSITYRFVQK